MAKAKDQTPNLFAENMRLLVPKGTNISKLCRDLKINRTQFNRYLAEGSIPSPDVLSKICDHFDVDARIILEPLEQVRLDRAKVATMKSRTLHATNLVGACELMLARNFGHDGDLADEILQGAAERIRKGVAAYHESEADLAARHEPLRG